MSSNYPRRNPSARPLSRTPCPFPSLHRLLSVLSRQAKNRLDPLVRRLGSSSTAAVVGERVVVKLKGYFELAKEEIDKAVRAEEWGLPDDAEVHYRNAVRVMLEAKAARIPDVVSSSERGQVRVYQEKIAKWQAQVEERLRVLGQRSGNDFEILAVETEGYSGSDLRALCEEAAMMPIRELGPHNILTVEANQISRMPLR